MDKKSILLLTKYYFPLAYGGLNPGDCTTPIDIIYLNSKGIFPDAAMSVGHSHAVARLRKAVAAADPRAVADAFIVGLQPDHCVHRAALRAYAVGRHFPAHSFKPHTRDNPNPACTTCGMAAEIETAPAYMELLRHRDGACGFSDQPFYAAHALEMFAASDPPSPKREDYQRMNKLIRILRDAKPSATANEIADRIRPIVQGNKYTRTYIIETLGYCGILETPDHRGFHDGWVRWIDNVRPANRNNEMDLPAAWWRGKDGINLAALRHFFPHRQIRC
ncbi:MAG: hypothetical protein FJ303_23460 [Planctomycetes bacterium]|nr:hypothetical protein [Planctomycetota bacterium]